jgi:Golgi nucleoside diphosphatase
MKFFVHNIIVVALSAIGSVESSSATLKYKHPLEERKSWDLHVSRQEQKRKLAADGTIASTARRFLQGSPMSDIDPKADAKADVNPEFPNYEEITQEYAEQLSNFDSGEADYTPYSIKHKKPKAHIPFAGGDTGHGMMIDAGSQGTRLHIYEWDKRIMLDEDDLLGVAGGKKLSYPSTSSRWTDKYTPGLDVFAIHGSKAEQHQAVADYLGPLIEFAKSVLKAKEDSWADYPIYLKATGGLRTLPQPERVRLMKTVRDLFNNKTFNPFDFEDERARVIAGEEEAIYGWVGVNFAKGLLIDASEGVGVAKQQQLTNGMIEMGGASMQVANLENDGDLMANLFKLSLGGARHWNVYVHSYLYSGINGAFSRLNGRLHHEGTPVNPCLPMGSEIKFTNWMHMNEEDQFFARSDPRSIEYTQTMINNATVYDHAKCSKMTYNLLRKRTNRDWCDFEMDANCGFSGIYQPPMPQVNSDIDEFVATSNFVDVYEFLQLPEKVPVREIEVATKKVCSLNFEELKKYNAKLPSPIETDLVLSQFCFRSNFVYQLLKTGFNFGDNYNMSAVDVINGQKMGWALGCMLYEINVLPWEFHPELLMRGPGWWLISLYIILGTSAGLAVGFMIAMRMSKKFNKAVRESKFFQASGMANNAIIRKSLAVPDMRQSLDELEQLYDDDEKAPIESDSLLKK